MESDCLHAPTRIQHEYKKSLFTVILASSQRARDIPPDFYILSAYSLNIWLVEYDCHFVLNAEPMFLFYVL